MGGRIRSEEIADTGFSAELGAMRFRQTHELLNALTDELGIKACRFDLPAPSFYVRGRHISNGDIAFGRTKCCAAELPYRLEENERGKTVVQLMENVIWALLESLSFPELDTSEARHLKERIVERNLTDKTWAKVKRYGLYHDTHLYAIGFSNLLQHFLSNEACAMIRDLMSLESIVANWSAAEAIPWFLGDFASDQFYMIPGGLSRITKALELEIRKGFGEASWRTAVTFHQKRTINAINLNKDHTWSITPGDGDERFDTVVLALPEFALQQLIVLDDGKPYVDSQGRTWPPYWFSWVKGHPMFKLFLLYENEWWNGSVSPKHVTGRIFTDLPLRQIYYFSPSWMKTHGFLKPGESKQGQRDSLALVMASYSDEHNVAFWEPLLTGPDHPYLVRSPRLSDEAWNEVLKIPSSLFAKKRMVDKAHRLLTEIHGTGVPAPLFGIFRNWDAGWHTWKVGARPWEITKERIQPLPNLFLCGEAYSNEQGWIEGALKSSELVLQALDVPAPTWTRWRGISDYEHYIAC
jgi:monoamine oxidase